MEAIDGTEQGSFAREGCPALGHAWPLPGPPTPKANSARRPSHSLVCGLADSTHRQTPPPCGAQGCGSRAGLWAVDTHMLQAAYQNRRLICLSAAYCCLRGLSHLGSNLDTVQAVQSSFGKSTFLDGPWGARGMMGHMPTGRAQCGSILSGTATIPLVHNRRIPPSESLVVNRCNAMRVRSFRGPFLARQTRHRDRGLCYCYVPCVCTTQLGRQDERAMPPGVCC